jgi:cardiolipin synthase
MIRHLPNSLTSLRIAAIPLLVSLALAHEHDRFVWLVIACLLADVIDGALARAMNVTSHLGAQLDSVADTLLFFATIAGAFLFYPESIRAHAVAFTIVPAAWLAENLAALGRYGRLSSFHTYLSRAAAVMMGTFLAALFALGMQPWLLHAAVVVVLIATAEEFVLLWLLPRWTADVRGLYWVLRDERTRA